MTLKSNKYYGQVLQIHLFKTIVFLLILHYCICNFECFHSIQQSTLNMHGFFFKAGPNDSHSHCNSFVVNLFLFFTPNGENSLCYTPKKQWEQYGGKNMFCLFFISKIYSHVTQKWWPKMGMAIPYCLCWKLLHTRQKYSDISNLFAKVQHAKAPES